MLHPEVHWGDEERVLLGYRCEDSGMTLAVGADHVIDTGNAYEVKYEVTEDLSRHVFRVHAEPGMPITLSKVVSYHSSRSESPAELITRVRRTLDRVRAEGVEQQLIDQQGWLGDYWARSDVEVEDQPEVQQAIRWCLFQLAQAAARAEGQGIAAKGVTGSGYGGHYFWDTEIYVVPYLVYTSPGLARNVLRFRRTMLPRRPPPGRGAHHAGRAVPVAHDQRRGGLGLLRRRHRAVPHQRRHLLRAAHLRPGHRGRGVPRPRGDRHPGRDRADVGRPGVLARATARTRSTSTA